MEHFKIVKTIIISFVTVFFLEITSFSYTRNYLLNECIIISRLINEEYGAHQIVHDYLSKKDYIFLYNENNIEKEGNIIEFSLIKEMDSLFIEKKEIVITQSLVLGSFF